MYDNYNLCDWVILIEWMRTDIELSDDELSDDKHFCIDDVILSRLLSADDDRVDIM